MDILIFSNIILWGVILIQFAYLYYLTINFAKFLKKLRVKNGETHYNSLGIAQQAPLFREKNNLNQEVVLADNSGNHTLLIFGEPNCGYCKDIIRNINMITEMFPLRVIVLSEKKKFDEEFHLPGIHFVVSRTIFENYMVTNVPKVFLLDKRNYIVSIPQTNESHGLKIHLADYFRSANQIKKLG